jgi:hypothetical protein
MRETGYYWIIESEEIGWELAYYSSASCWNLIKSGHVIFDEDLIEIDEKQIKRE